MDLLQKLVVDGLGACQALLRPILGCCVDASLWTGACWTLLRSWQRAVVASLSAIRQRQGPSHGAAQTQIHLKQAARALTFLVCAMPQPAGAQVVHGQSRAAPAATCSGQITQQQSNRCKVRTSVRQSGAVHGKQPASTQLRNGQDICTDLKEKKKKQSGKTPYPGRTSEHHR